MPEFDPENITNPKDRFKVSLVKMRGLYSNRVPDKVLHSNNPDNRFKVRKGWQVGLSQCIELYTDRRKEALDTSTFEEYEAFRAELVRNWKNLTTVEDINRANSLINTILGVPAETEVPYDRVIAATNHALGESGGKTILRWHGMNEDEIVSRLPNYHYAHTYNIWEGKPKYTSPTGEHEGWVIVRYSSAYQGDGKEVANPEKRIQERVKTDFAEWEKASDATKRLLILAGTLPSPYIFVDPSFPWQTGPFRQPPTPVWTVAFDGLSEIMLTKHNLRAAKGDKGNLAWRNAGTIAF